MKQAVALSNRIGWSLHAQTHVDAKSAYRHGLADLFEVTDLDPGDFFNENESFNFGPVVIGRGRSVAQTLTRDAEKVRRSQLDNFGLVLDFAGLKGDFDGVDVCTPGGVVHVRDLARPAASRVNRIDLIALTLPRTEVPAALLERGLHGQAISGWTARFLAAHLESFHASAREMSETDAVFAAQIAFSLCEKYVAPDLKLSPQQAQGAYLTIRSMAKGEIKRRLLDPDLTPQKLARSIGVSRTTLYRAFEPVGGVSAYVMAERLDRARDQIVKRGGHRPTIGEIAYRHGFASTPHFNRVFRARFGMAPGEAGEAFRTFPKGDRAGVEAVDRHGVIIDWLRGG